MTPVESFELEPGVRVPRVIVGLWQLSAGHAPQRPDAATLLRELERFVEAGLSTFDCADIYTGVEELLGALIRRVGPRRVRVHTKLVPDLQDLARVDRAYVERIVDRSLRRLGVERLDLVQFSWWDYAVPGYVDVMGWLGELQRAGKVRHVGTTNFDVPRLRQMTASGTRMSVHQVQYSLLDRRPENALVGFCRERDARLVCYGSLAGGFLSERWLGAPEPQPPWPNRSLAKYRLIVEEYGGWAALQELLGVLAEVARRHGVSVANVAARWVLERERVGAVILGAHDARHLEDNLRTLSLRLDAEDEAVIGRVLARRRGPAGDVFGLERDTGGPHWALMRTDLNRAGS